MEEGSKVLIECQVSANPPLVDLQILHDSKPIHRLEHLGKWTVRDSLKRLSNEMWSCPSCLQPKLLNGAPAKTLFLSLSLCSIYVSSKWKVKYLFSSPWPIALSLSLFSKSLVLLFQLSSFADRWASVSQDRVDRKKERKKKQKIDDRDTSAPWMKVTLLTNTMHASTRFLSAFFQLAFPAHSQSVQCLSYSVLRSCHRSCVYLNLSGKPLKRKGKGR